jgi:hypothetical protein
MISEQSLPESWRPTRRKLEQRLAETYLSLAETARVLENASIDGGMLLTESPPLVRWNQIIGRYRRIIPKIRSWPMLSPR